MENLAMRRHIIAAGFVGAAAFLAHAQAQRIDAPTLKTGDTWRYSAVDGYNKARIGSLTREVANGKPITRTENPRLDNIAFAPEFAMQPFPLEPGRSWSQRIVWTEPATRNKHEAVVVNRVGNWETVKVPAGEFKALRIERMIYLGDRQPFREQTTHAEVQWYAPEVKGPVKLQVFEESKERPPRGRSILGDRLVYELDSYKELK